MAGLAGQPSAGRHQRHARTPGGGGEPEPDMGREACHRRGRPLCRGRPLLGRRHDGHAHPGRLRHPYLQHLGAQHPGHQGSEPHAAEDARPYPALAVARQRETAQRRRHQPLGEGRQQRGELPDRDHPQHHLDADDVPRCLLLPLLDGPLAVGHHHCHAAVVHPRQPLLRQEDALPDTSGARQRLEGAERPAGNDSEPHAHQDDGERRGDGRQA